jgi:hypothetical protein
MLLNGSLNIKLPTPWMDAHGIGLIMEDNLPEIMTKIQKSRIHLILQLKPEQLEFIQLYGKLGQV